jgi:prepilin-type N-terminal cleavage/methylation domain-containing protein
MNAPHTRGDRRGFTLLEVVIATAVTSMMFAALLSTSVSLQRSFVASDKYSSAKSDQVRAIDYIVRDLRGALTITLAGNSQSLSVTLPDYNASYDSNGNPSGAPVAPTLNGSTVDYGDPAKPITVSYFVRGKSLVREVTIGKTNATSRSVIGTGLSDFTMNFGQLDSIVNVDLTFSTSFQTNSSNPNDTTKLSAAVSVRNVKRN